MQVGKFHALSFFATFGPFNAKLGRHDGLRSRMHSLDEFATAKLGEYEHVVTGAAGQHIIARAAI